MLSPAVPLPGRPAPPPRAPPSQCLSYAASSPSPPASSSALVSDSSSATLLRPITQTSSAQLAVITLTAHVAAPTSLGLGCPSLSATPYPTASSFAMTTTMPVTPAFTRSPSPSSSPRRLEALHSAAFFTPPRRFSALPVLVLIPLHPSWSGAFAPRIFPFSLTCESPPLLRLLFSALT